MKDIISSRISTEGYEDIYDYFRKSGMPVIPNELIYKLWTAPFENHPDLNEWWLHNSSKTYQKYLITHPGYFFFRPFQKTNSFNKPVYSYLTPDLHFHEQVVPNKIQIMFTNQFLWVIFIASLFLILFTYRYNKKVDLPKILLPAFLLTSGAILYLIIWHADIGELDRHLIQCALMIRLGLIMLFVISINSIISTKH